VDDAAAAGLPGRRCGRGFIDTDMVSAIAVSEMMPAEVAQRIVAGLENGLVPPPGGSEVEKAWAKANVASP